MARIQGETLGRFRSYLRLLAEVQIGGNRAVGRKLDPSDLVQDTLLEAWRDLGSFRGRSEAELQAWLRRILARNVANACRDLRCAKRDVRRERSLERALGRSSVRLERLCRTAGPSPSTQVARGEVLLRLANGIAGLPAAQREALVSRYLDGRGVAEIAVAMGRTEASVAGLLRRALKRLREELRDLE